MFATFQLLSEMFTSARSSRLIACLTFALIVLYLISSLRVAFRKGLRRLPGPFVARLSGLYRFSLVYAGRAPQEYLKVHQKYGPIVRVGPNHVSISDPAAITQIYGIGSNYVKVVGAATFEES